MKSPSKKILIIIEIIIAGIIAISALIFYFQFLRGLPRIDIDDFQTLPQASIITDREGNELFRFYSENRREVPYDGISHHMINAIVATEDKGFWVNQGVEWTAIARAIQNNISNYFGQESQLQGASTITQQLVKNVLLSKQKTLKRKLQEIILAQRLTQKRQNAIEDQHSDRDTAQVKQKTKESILATYLNYVYYGNHSYGIAAAAENYFHTTPELLTPTQSAILSSLPQSPSTYNPINNPEIVMGRRILQDQENNTLAIYPHLDSSWIVPITTQLKQSSIEIQSPEDTCKDSLHKWANNITIEGFSITYEIGRKDRVLCRMYEDGYLSLEEVHQSVLDATTITLHRSTSEIRAPHFVFRIQKFLQSAPFLQDYHIDDTTLSQAGWTIRTSLDPQDQKIANSVVAQNMKHVYRNGGNNRALIHVDSENGDVRAYVGSADYYNTEIKGQNDMIQAIRQVGSTLKPLIYAYIFSHFGRDIETKISDMPLPAAYAPEGQPSNADRRYRGNVPIKHALAGSRNIPLIRIFYALGRERTFVPYLRSLGFTNLEDNFPYGYSLLLGAGQGSMIQLANSYIGLSSDSEDTIAQINPIISITDSNNTTIYSKEVDTSYRQKRIIPLTVSYMIWSSLSYLRNAPQERYYYLVIPSMEPGTYAIKTGTSEKKYGKASFPNDAWIASYTNRDIIISRAGHTDGKAMGDEGYGLFLNHRIIKDYYRSLAENNMILGGNKNIPAWYEGVYTPVKDKIPTEKQRELLQQ